MAAYPNHIHVAGLVSVGGRERDAGRPWPGRQQTSRKQLSWSHTDARLVPPGADPQGVSILDLIGLIPSLWPRTCVGQDALGASSFPRSPFSRVAGADALYAGAAASQRLPPRPKIL
jgi:hypothetical protein